MATASCPTPASSGTGCTSCNTCPELPNNNHIPATGGSYPPDPPGESSVVIKSVSSPEGPGSPVLAVPNDYTPGASGPTVKTSCETCPPESAGAIPEDPDELDPTDLGVEIGTVTEERIDGNGVFDIYMRAGNNQLNTQYELGRIKGAEYAAAFVAMQESMMTQASNFVLEKYKADIVLAKTEYEISDLISRKTMHIKKTEAEIQLIATQELEMRRDGAAKRTLVRNQAHETLAKTELLSTQELEMRKDGITNRTLTKEKANQIKTDTKFTATKELEMRRDGVSKRTLEKEQATEIKAKTKLTDTQEIESRRNGIASRTLDKENANTSRSVGRLNWTKEIEMRRDGATKRALETVQRNELAANGLSKRKLEDGQTNVAHAQCNLYNRQADGFRAKAANDTYRVTMNAWAIQAAELDETPQSVTPLTAGPIAGTINSAKGKVGLS